MIGGTAEANQALPATGSGGRDPVFGPANAADMTNMNWHELTVLPARLSLDASTDVPSIENEATTVNAVPTDAAKSDSVSAVGNAARV